MEKDPRRKDNKDLASGSNPTGIHGQDSQTKKLADKPSSSGSSSSQPSHIRTQRVLLFNKTLTHVDVTEFKIMIPLESGRRFLPVPRKVRGRYNMEQMLITDHANQIWPMVISFHEATNIYEISLNWDRYFKRYSLEAEDLIFLYYDPDVVSMGHFWIECKKKWQQSNSITNRILLGKDTLTRDDLTQFKIMIPLESGKGFLAAPEKVEGRYMVKQEMSIKDQHDELCHVDISFEEVANSYVVSLKWLDEYTCQHYELKAGDVISLYHYPEVTNGSHFLIEYEKAVRPMQH